jgi:hypothetical protein
MSIDHTNLVKISAAVFGNRMNIGLYLIRFESLEF